MIKFKFKKYILIIREVENKKIYQILHNYLRLCKEDGKKGNRG